MFSYFKWRDIATKKQWQTAYEVIAVPCLLWPVCLPATAYSLLYTAVRIDTPATACYCLFATACPFSHLPACMHSGIFLLLSLQPLSNLRFQGRKQTKNHQ